MAEKDSSAKRIKAVRIKLGLTMEEFAQKIDEKASSGTVANWETGSNLPNATRLARIADLGHVSVPYLRGVSDDPGTNQWTEAMLKSAAELSQQRRNVEDAAMEFLRVLYTTAATKQDLSGYVKFLKKQTEALKHLE
ncbi:helix-turn-helix domain-containing protein [Lactiplantibacillus plajomi]|jgi:transcriptional regulator with XRE-family HTH domain|uniref:Helix-turn-helix domain-containing protein n=1 Tax=Lactiplantibacillus plajomi TaxID=1457217 RepID=A0ABV6K4M3_9LACO|nr:helix-turn-helix transcriptional regulator [Lactiplantibacillus plajomi]